MVESSDQGQNKKEGKGKKKFLEKGDGNKMEDHKAKI